MKLSSYCPSAEMSASQFAMSEVELEECCRTENQYFLSGPERPLCGSRNSEDEAYRFFWKSSFNGDAVVHIARKNRSITLRSRRIPRVARDVSSFGPLGFADWEKLQEALEVAQFWSLKSDEDLLDGFDGAQWLIEGRRGDHYHAVRRWCPGGTVHEVGRLFFVLAGAPLSDVKLY